MVRFKTIIFSYLPNEAHYNYDTKVKKEINASPLPVLSALGNLVTDYNALYEKEEDIMLWVKKSVITKKISEADRRMGRALTALRAHVRGLEYDTDSLVSQAAHRVYVMLMSYGNVNAKPYQDKEGDVRAILRQISVGGQYHGDIILLSELAYVILNLATELQNALNNLEELIAERGAEYIKKPAMTSKNVRKQIEAVYREIVTIINAGAQMDLSPGFAAIINRLNPEIELLNREHHRIRHSIAFSQTEQIPPQEYTGKPVIFVPKVLYVTPKGNLELELGRDFDVSFENNVREGNARCIIYGKGAFKDKKMVSFTIKKTPPPEVPPKKSRKQVKGKKVGGADG
ncbi:MAG: DUF6261 family protein [Dysgonamonadaceae bacterium]|jgi:hypothetical protein|nr:DUF6261 family protein [Dysgonamonadaceae bacterium]